MPTLNQDISFLKFYKTLNEAIVNEMPPITELPEARFIQQLPNETFKQITNCDTGVGFIGGMTAELVTLMAQYLVILQPIFITSKD